MRNAFALIVTVIIMTLLAALGIFGVSMISADLDIAMQTMQSAEAFYLAEAGLQRTITKLLTDSNYRASPTTLIDALGEGAFSVAVAKNSNIYTLNSVATVDSVTRQIQQSVIIFKQGPAAFGFGVYSYGDIFMNSADMAINGNVATEGEIYQNSTNLTLDGELTEHATIDELSVDIHSYKSIANQVYNGSKTFSNVTLNGIYYVKGDVIIQNTVTLNGSIIAEGDITLNSVIDSSITAIPGYPALVSESDIIFNSVQDSTINGLIYSDDDIVFNSVQDVTFSGVIIAENDIGFNSCQDFTISFDPMIALGSLPYFSDSQSGEWAATPQPDWDEQ